jgi:3-hydroxyisobutyrate dehydrogenase-like beta-hydroxyacid dehydrogenase
VREIGMIGLGLLGSALAERFLRAGLRVTGYDIRAECRSRLAELGGTPAASAGDVARSVDVVVFSLPDSGAVAAVINEIESELGNKAVIDTTTGDPDETAQLGKRLTANGVRYLDATVVGSSQQARNGDVIVIAGGEVETFRLAGEWFRHFAKHWFHVGPWGNGARMKLVVNLVLGLNRAVLAEGLSFAKRCGLDPALALEVLESGAAYSRVMDTKGGKMIAGDFAPEARLSQHLKDVRLILEQGRRCGATLPLSQLHEELLGCLEAAGLGELDNSAVIRAFDVS